MEFVNFDKVYVIHCVENEKRYDNILFQMDNNKWLNDNLEIWWTCYQPHSDILANAMIFSNKSRKILNGAEINLCREFYTIVKTSYYRNYNYICVFEDDFSLIKEKFFYDYLNAIPKDFDVIQLSYLFMNDLNKTEYIYNHNELFFKPKYGFWSTCGICLSRKGMKYFIDIIDKEMLPADIPFFELKNDQTFLGKINQNNGLNNYITNIPIIFVSNDDTEIQTNNKDVNTIYSHYKFLDKTLYNVFE